MMPSPSPTRLPTTPIPSSSPSFMPSPSPSPMPSALPSPAPSMPPTTHPTYSPTQWDHPHCRCFEITSTQATRYEGIYRATGEQRNDHEVWRDADNKIIHWEMDESPEYWIIKDGDIPATYQVTTEEWTLTPPTTTT